MEVGLGLKRVCGIVVGGREDSEGEKVVLSKEPDSASGEAVEASRDVYFHLSYFKLQKEIHNIGGPVPGLT